MKLLPLILLMGCVLDRTGQSVTSGYERELALQKNRAAELERLNGDLQRRISQLEEVTRYQGQQEAAKMENLDQVRGEVQRLRGDFEVMVHTGSEATELTNVFREDADFRLQYLQLRVGALESTLGLSPPPPPELEGQGAGIEVAPDGEVDLTPGDPVEVELPSTPEDRLALAEKQLTAGQPKVARVVLERFLAEHPDHERRTEALYRYAESFFNDSQYQTAILRFEDVVGEAPDSPWAPWAMVRQGECFKALGKGKEAELFWEDVLSRYPRSKAAADARELLGR